MRTYASLSDAQLIELADLLTKNSLATSLTRVDRNLPESDHHILVTDSNQQETMFTLKTGQVRCYLDGRAVHLYNVFQFVHKCREFGLSY